MPSHHHRRPRAEQCKRLTISHLRSRVTPGDASYILRDGQKLELRWSPCRGCFGGGEGLALVIACPICSRNCRVLWHPPGRSWGCCACRPVSHASHRRSGSSTSDSKPPLWRLDQLNTEQARTARLLGLQEWPPNKLLWCLTDLKYAPLRPDAPRLSRRRRHALLVRLECLDRLRIALMAGGIRSEEQALSGDLAAWPDVGHMAQAAAIGERLTRWAVRRGPHDARTLRARRSRKEHTSVPAPDQG